MLKTHVVNLNRDAKDLSRDLQRLEVRGKLGSKTLYFKKMSSLLTQNRLINCQNLTLFHELKKRTGTWLSPPGQSIIFSSN